MPEVAASRQAPESWSQALSAALLEQGVTWVAHVPDEVTGVFLSALEADANCTVLTLTREEEAVGVLAGVSLSGDRSALVMQASGVGNSLNALASLCVPCNVPMLLIVSERGGLHEFNPCQVPLGKSAARILEAIGVQTFALDHVKRVGATVRGAADLAFTTQQPVALFVTTLLTGGRG